MDIDKYIEIASTYLTDYVEFFIKSTVTPVCFIVTGAKPSTNNANIDDGSVKRSPLNIDSALWVFVFISIFIGSNLSIISGLHVKDDLKSALVYVVTSWSAFSGYTFIIARLILRGRASFVDTLIVSLRVLSVIYVISSFFALIGSFAPPFMYKSGPHRDANAYIYILTQAICIAFYLTWNISKLNGFGYIRTFVLILFLPIPIVIINSIVLLSGATGIVVYIK